MASDKNEMLEACDEQLLALDALLSTVTASISTLVQTRRAAFESLSGLAEKEQLTKEECVDIKNGCALVDKLDERIKKKIHKREQILQLKHTVTLLLPIAMRYGTSTVQSPKSKVAQRTASRNTGRPPQPFWKGAKTAAKEWLADNGFPEPGDGGQAQLERHVADWLARGDINPSVPSVRRYVRRWINEYRAEIGLLGHKDQNSASEQIRTK